MLVHFITHCYADKLPQYAALLTYQLSGFALHPSKTATVAVTVCHTPEDVATRRVLDHFPFARIIPLSQQLDRLGRRAIGRNIAALLMPIADYVVFTDVDYIWHGEAIDALIAGLWPDDAVMVYPGLIQISRDHDTGDRQWALASNNHHVPIDIDPGQFVDKTYNRAIGGCQIVRGDYARAHGYLRDDPKWQAPQTGAPFSNFSDDVAYRTFAMRHGSIRRIDLPGVYRIRHGQKTY